MSILPFLWVGFFGPLVGAVIAACAGSRQKSNTVVQAIYALSSIIGGIAAGWVLCRLLSGSISPVEFGLSGMPIDFFLDPLAAFFLLLIHIGTLLASLFAMGYVPKYAKVYSFAPLHFASGVFLFGMQATVLAHSLFGFLLFWEVMSVAAYFLVIADREDASIKAGLLYFVMTHLGFVCLLAGFFILSHGDPGLTFESLQAHGGFSIAASATAFFLIFAGFGSKAGLVPLHQWLLKAHPQAPSHSSALMSGVMLKVAVYGFLRVAFSAFPAIPLTWAIVVTVIGLLSAFFGVLNASVETDLKRMLAWSSIENLGLIFSMIGMGLIFASLGLSGTPFFIAALLHAINHTIFKSGLFMAAGAIISETHTRDMNEMGGFANVWPVFSAAFLGLVLAAAALPPFGTFYGEWIFFQGLASGMLLVSSKITVFFLGAVLSITALVSGLAVFTFAKTFSAIFLSKPHDNHTARMKPLSGMLLWPIVIAAGISLGIGFLASSIAGRLGGIIGGTSSSVSPVSALRVSDGFIVPTVVLLLTLLSGILVMLFRRFATSQRPIRLTNTWDCGQPLTERMKTTAAGFSAPILFFFRSILRAKKHDTTERVTPGNAWVLRHHVVWSTRSIWEDWFYGPIVRTIEAAAITIKKLQNGIIQFYILLILLTLVIVLAFTL